MLEDSVQERLRKKDRRDKSPGSCPKSKIRIKLVGWESKGHSEVLPPTQPSWKTGT